MPASNTPPGGPGGRGDLTPEEREAFKHRADDLGKRLETAKAHDGSVSNRGRAAGSPSDGTVLGQAMQISTTLIVSILVGCGLGWVIDAWLTTAPIGFVVGFLLGASAGLYGVVRAGMAMKSGPSNPDAGPSVPDDEET